jgi:hypothetical protein
VKEKEKIESAMLLQAKRNKTKERFRRMMMRDRIGSGGRMNALWVREVFFLREFLNRP